jgi:hypothetical protein
VYEVGPSFSEPLTLVTQIRTEMPVYKIVESGNELLLGEVSGYLQIVDLKGMKINHTQKFEEVGAIYDMVAINASQFLLAGVLGLLKTTKKKALRHYYSGWWVSSLCPVKHSLYLVGISNRLIVWDLHKNEELLQLTDAWTFSIRQVTMKSFIIKTKKEGVKVLTISDLHGERNSLQSIVEGESTEEDWSNHTDGMHAIVSENQIVVAATMNAKVEGRKKKSIKVMQIAMPKF